MKKYIISKDIFESVYLQQGGQATPQLKQGEQEQLVQQVAQALSQGVDPQEILQQLVNSGIDQNEATQLIQSIIQQMQGEQQPQEETPQYQKGGKKKVELESDAGIVQTALPKSQEDMANAEIESGEHIQDSKGIREAVGDKHRQGGMDVALEDNTKVLSDHLKVDERAEELSEKLGVKVKPTYTYAKVLDIYNKNSGLDEINDEVLGLMQKLKKQQEGKQSETSDINTEFLIKKIEEKTQEKKPIEKEQQMFFDTLFDLQESSKSNNEKSQEEYEDGGLLAISQKYNIPIENLRQAVQKYQEGGTSRSIQLNEVFVQGKRPVKEIVRTPAPTQTFAEQRFKMTDAERNQLKTMYGNTYENMLTENADKVKVYLNGMRTTPTYQQGGILDELGFTNILKNTKYFQMGGTSTSKNNTISSFTNQPVALNYLPYTPIESATYPKWVGDNYTSQWKPWVNESLADPNRAKQIEDWLLNSPQYGDNIREQIGNLTGQSRIDRIKYLATDGKPGVFHDAVAKAIVETAPPEQAATPSKTKTNSVDPFTNSGGTNTIMGTLDMPTRPINMPTWDPSLKVSTRLNTIDPALISPEQQLAETDRAVLGAQQDLQNLSPVQRALANVSLTANAVSSNNKVIADTNRFNSQAQNQADVYNARILDQEQQAENQNALSYEARTLTGKSRFENDLQNMKNQQFRDQTEKWKNTMIYNANNALSPDVQFDGQKYNVAKPTLSSMLNNLSEEDKKKALDLLKKPKKKYGGRFKK